MKKTYRKPSNDCEPVTGHSGVFNWFTKRCTTRHLYLHQHQHQLAFPMLVFLLSLTTITTALTTTIISLNSSSNVFALTYQDNVDLKFTFNPSITISVSDLTIPSLGPGSSSDSNIATVSVSSNARAGYTLSSTVGSTESTSTYYNYGTDLRISGTDSTNIFTNLGSTTAPTLNDISSNQWGYSYISCLDASCNTTTGNWKSGNINVANGTTDGYGGYATTSTSITHISTNTPGDSAIQYKIGAKASTTQASGTYTNVINFIGVANPVVTEYTLSYASNVQDTTNLPSNTTGTTTDGTFNISKTIPTLSDTTRIFKGWCTINNTGHTSSCTDGTNTGSIIQPGGLYTIGSDASTFTGTVYAVWISNTPTTIAELTYMQDFAALTSDEKAVILNNMAEEESAILKDSRDEQEYTVAKLKDGKLWMTKNLNIAGGTNLDSEKTDVDSSYIANFTTSNNLTKEDNTIKLPTSSTSGFNTNNYSYVYNSNRTNCSSPGCYSYYSWDAATLGSGRSISTDNTDAPYSICPKGWKLPTTYNGTDSSTDFRALMIAFGGSSTVQTYNSSTSPLGSAMSTTLQSSPNNFLLTGRYNASTFYSGGSVGSYWSSTSYSNTSNARPLVFNSSSVNSADNYGRTNGLSVRCLLHGYTDIDEITYMQDFTNLSGGEQASVLSSMVTGAKYTLKDSRDEQEYAVAKLADGNLWMLDNLALDISDSTVRDKMNTSNTNTTEAGLTMLGNTINGTDSSTWSNSYTAPYINNTNKDVQVTSYGTAAVNGKAKVGIYYNYCAASGGTYCMSNSSSGNASYDICPAGWHLPAGDQSAGSFYYLYNNSTYGYASSTVNFRNALSTPLSGYFFNGSASNHNTSGCFWSSSYTGTTSMYRLGVDSSNVYPQNNSYRSYGFSVRCMSSK